MLSRPVPATCIVLILVCRKTCCTIAAYRYTCTYNMPYSLSYIRKQCDDRLWVSLKFFPLTSLIFITRARILQSSPDHWMWLPWWWRQQELQQCLCSYFSPFIINLLITIAYTVITMIAADFPNHAFNFYDFLHWFVTVLYFQHYEIYLLTGWVHILNSMFIKSKYQW
jgi:hypothetical protein